MDIQIDSIYKSLYNFIKSRINNETDAQDITQDVFLKLSASDLAEVKHLKSWMYTIAKNSIIDYYRKKKVQLNDNIANLSNEDTDDGSVEELSSCMHTFINQLPDDYQNLMMLSDINGIPQKEIAEQLNINYTTVRSKIQRGREKLKKMFTNCCTIEQDKRNSIINYERKGNNCQSTPGSCTGRNRKC